LSKPEYANWVPLKLVWVPGALALVLAGLALLYPWIALPAMISFMCSAYFAYARWQFSAGGGDLQVRIQHLLLGRLHWDGSGKVLDIGCGNGPVTIAIAKAYPSAQVTGIDYWGTSWEYSRAVCEGNAAAEGVTHRVTFKRGSAESLPFPDGTFDAAVSNLVFHEVRSVADKKILLKEALRVLKKGGIFVFQDLFLWGAVYGDTGQLLDAIRGWGVEAVALSRTNEADFIPKLLKLPFMVGTIAIIEGTM
jgi:SAM-dependent methyltransferase